MAAAQSKLRTSFDALEIPTLLAVPVFRNGYTSTVGVVSVNSVPESVAATQLSVLGTAAAGLPYF